MPKEMSCRFARFVGLSLVIAGLAAPSAGLAQNSGAGANTGGVLAAQLESDPAAFLALYPQGGLALNLALQGVIQSNPTVSGAIVAAAANATPIQINVIAHVLATAARFYLISNPAAAQSIQLAVANSGNTLLIDAFNAAINETATAALPGGQGGGAGVSPIGDVGGPPPGNPVGNGAGGGGFGGGGGGSGFAGVAFTTTTQALAVSPGVNAR